MVHKKQNIRILEGKVKGKISINDLKFSEVHTRTVEKVSKNSNTGRVYLPPELVNKEVYILVKK